MKALLLKFGIQLAIKFADWVYSNLIMKDVAEDVALKKEERKALARAVKNAQTDEDRRLLSIAIGKFNKLSIDEYKRVQQQTSNK